MNAVRILLIIIGFSLLTGIVWWERQRRIPPNRREREVFDGSALNIPADGGEPFLDLSGLDGITATSGGATDASFDIAHRGDHASTSRAQSAEEKLVVLNLVALADQPYTGADLLAAIQGSHLVYGEMSIFHHYVRGQRRPIFSMANMVEPGTFDPPSMDDFITPGLTLFMRLPGHMKGPEAFERMLKSAEHLATELGGTLCDQHRRPLDKQAITKLRAEIVKHQQRVDSIPRR